MRLIRLHSRLFLALFLLWVLAVVFSYFVVRKMALSRANQAMGKEIVLQVDNLERTWGRQLKNKAVKTNVDWSSGLIRQMNQRFIGKEGFLVVREGDEVLGNRFMDEAVLNRILSQKTEEGEEHFFVSSDRWHSRFVVYREYFAPLHWEISWMIPYEKIEQESQEGVQKVALIVGIVLCLVFLGLVLAAQYRQEKIRRLTAYLRALSRGEQTDDVEFAADVEFGDAFQEFDRLQEGIQASQLQQHQLVSSLEESLSEKTSELNSVEKQWLGILDNSPLPIIQCDHFGNIRFMNNRTLGFFGESDRRIFSRVNLLEDPVFVESGISGKIRVCLSEKAVQVSEHRFLGKWGDVLHLRIHLSPLTNMIRSGETDVLMIVEDVSRQQKVREALEKAKEEAESANRSKAYFLSNLSHEVRTPMNGILGFLHLLQKTTLDEDQTEYLGIAVKSASNLHHLINELLDYTKIEVGKLELQKKEFVLKEKLDNLMERFQPQADEKGLNLQYLMADNIPDILKGDGDRLLQVLSNLVSNGIKFTEKGGVSVQVNIKEESMNKVLLHCAVHDTGIGIKAEDKRKLFDFFTQVDGSHTRKYEGVGIGLAVAAKLVTLMNGKISINSTVDEGSEFRVEVPFLKTDT